MAKVLGTFGAVERYVLRRDDVDHQLTAMVPEKVDVLHACLLPEEPWTGLHAVIADATEPVVASSQWESLQAACGRRTKVFLPVPFDTDHPKACQKCTEALDERTDG